MSGEDFNNFSLAVLRLQTLERLSHSLNPKKLLRSVDGRLRDWSGLADLAKLSPEEKLKVESAYKKDHTRAIIAIWCNRYYKLRTHSSPRDLQKYKTLQMNSMYQPKNPMVS